MFTGWAGELATCRKFAPTARNYAACQLMAEVGLRVNEARILDLADIKWDLGPFGKLHVRHGKGARGSGPRERMVPLINGAGPDPALVHRGRLGPVRRRPPPAWCSRCSRPERHRSRRHHPPASADDTLRAALADAAATHLPGWRGQLTPHVLRHFCASQLYLRGMDLIAIQEMLGHAWIATTMRYVHVTGDHVEDAWVAGQQRAATRLEGTSAMQWNLRLAAANRGIWKACELQRLLAEHGLVISAREDVRPVVGPAGPLKLDDLDVICVVLGCGDRELLIPEPELVKRPDEQRDLPATAASTGGPPVTPKRRDGRSLPPV